MSASVEAVPPVGVVIATRDRRDSLLETLTRLAELPERPPIVVVDNASGDGTAEAVARLHPEVELIALERNHGAFARNLGAARLLTPVVAFSDDDSWWVPGALARAAAAFGAHDALGLVAARILVGDERRLDPVSSLMEGPVPPGLPGPRVDGFLACGSVVRRSAFLAVGGFCKRYMIGGEEALLAIDLGAAGWDLCYLEQAVAVHVPHRESRGNRSEMAIRNDLWTSWLRRPVRRAIGDSAELCLAATHDTVARHALASALRGLPWALRNRRRAPLPKRGAAPPPPPG